ncbi:uncharacterized protein [Solanum lycopersicum]|uniref:uncharacterized protein n=1 Tax=Solanum lycopersicum TaxID=4081 RepID=UPI003749BFB0
MAVTTQGGKKTIDPLRSSGVENVIRDKVVKVSGELGGKIWKEAEVPQKVTPMPRPPPPFPERLMKKTEDGKYQRFITMLKQRSVNVPLIEALEQMPGYAKFMKDMVIKKRLVIFEDDDRMQHSLCDPGASINLIPFSIYKKLGLGDQKPTAMRLLIVDRMVNRPIGILYDVFVKVESLIFLVDFVILDCEVDFEVLIILARPFLATGRALVDMEKGKIKFR